MRLGDVVSATEPEPERPRPRWRRRDLLFSVFALMGLGATALTHGPGVVSLEADEVLVVTNDTGRAWLGPARQAVAGPGLAVYLPVAHYPARLSTAPRALERRLALTLADGQPAIARSVKVRYQLDPGYAVRALDSLGQDLHHWDEVVALLAEAALGEVARAASPVALARSEGATRLAEGARGRLTARLLERGLRLTSLSVRGLSVDSGFSALVANLDGLDGERREVQGQREAQRAVAAQAMREVDGRREPAYAEREAALTAVMLAAEQRAKASRDEADRAVLLREIRAAAERDARITRGLAEAEALSLEAQVLGTRAQALVGPGADALLKRSVARTLVPQLSRVSVNVEPKPAKRAKKATQEKPAAPEPEKLATEKPATEKPATEKPAPEPEKLATEKPAQEKAPDTAPPSGPGGAP